MKYLIMMMGDADTMMVTKSPEWIRGMIAFMGEMDTELRAAGELVDSQGLDNPGTAKTVRMDNGVPVATDGPFAEAKESLAGYWLVEVADEERALAIAAKTVAFTGEPLEVRRVADGPPEV